MAAYLGTAKEVHMPYNTYYGGFEGSEQSLTTFDDASASGESVCRVYHDVKYWYPSLDMCSDPSKSAKESN
jgi:hypothetical protein